MKMLRTGVIWGKAPMIFPSWAELAETVDRREVLKRACLHKLARSAGSNLSASELAHLFPTLGVGQRAQLVRETLRNGECFSQPYAGRWQVGYPVEVRNQKSCLELPP